MHYFLGSTESCLKFEAYSPILQNKFVFDPTVLMLQLCHSECKCNCACLGRYADVPFLISTSLHSSYIGDGYTCQQFIMWADFSAIGDKLVCHRRLSYRKYVFQAQCQESIFAICLIDLIDFSFWSVIHIHRILSSFCRDMQKLLISN